MLLFFKRGDLIFMRRALFFSSRNSSSDVDGAEDGGTMMPGVLRAAALPASSTSGKTRVTSKSHEELLESTGVKEEDENWRRDRKKGETITAVNHILWMFVVTSKNTVQRRVLRVYEEVYSKESSTV